MSFKSICFWNISLRRQVQILLCIKRETDKNYLNFKLMRDPLLNKNIGVSSLLSRHTLFPFSLDASFCKEKYPSVRTLSFSCLWPPVVCLNFVLYKWGCLGALEKLDRLKDPFFSSETLGHHVFCEWALFELSLAGRGVGVQCFWMGV